MPIKRCTEITYFEKWQPLLLHLCPQFFNGEYPDIEKGITTIKKASKNPPNTESDKRVYKETLLILHSFYNSYTKRLDDVKIDLQRLQAGKYTKKEREEAMDQCYLARLGATIVNNQLSVTLDKQQQDKDESDIWIVLRNMLNAFFMFNKCGRNNIVVEEQIMHELVLTGVKGVTADFLKLPYKSFLFSLPHNTALTIRSQLIRSIYITESVAAMESDDKGDALFTGASRHIELFYVDANGNMDSGQFIINDTDNLIDQVEKQVTAKYDSPLAKNEADKVISFVLAAILYINSQEKVEQQIMPTVLMKNKHSRFPSCALGYGIPINKSIHTHYQSAGSSHQINVLRFTVRGHFRTYKVEEGKKWKESKVIYIKPFLKGTDRDNTEAVIKPKNYELK